MPSPSRRLPRSLIPLSILVLVAGAFLILSPGGEDPDANAIRGLLPFPADSVAVIEVRGSAQDVRLELRDGLWRLGGLIEDRVDPGNAARLVQALGLERTVPVDLEAEGSDPARFGLGAAAVQMVTVSSAQGRRVRFEVGQGNPVIGRVYVRIEGRDGIFTIDQPLAQSLAFLPGNVRLRVLWPAFAADEVDTVRLLRPGAPATDVFVRDPDGRWWMREPAGARLGRVLLDFDRHHGDRRRESDGAVWRLASGRRLRELLFLMTDTEVKSFWSGRVDETVLRRAGLLPPVAAVSAAGRFAASPLSAAFGEVESGPEDGAEDEGGVAALRDGRPDLMVVDGRARELLYEPLPSWLAQTVLDFPFASVEGFTVEGAGGVAWPAERAGRHWRALTPDLSAERQNAADNYLSDLALHLERLPIERVFPPRPDDDPRAGEERFAVEIRRGADLPPVRLELGWLEEDGDGPVAVVWMPADGKLLGVPEAFLHTLRTLTGAMIGE